MFKRILQAVGILAVLMGLLWMGQGLGVIRWPASSAMVDVRSWFWWGLLLAVVGVVILRRARGRRG